MIIERQINFRQGQRTRKEVRESDDARATPMDRVPRISRLMALAIRFDQLIRDGVVADQAELAQLGHVTRARLTQIMNLLSLAPEIQEAILFLPTAKSKTHLVAERQLRPIVRSSDWAKQRLAWQSLNGT